MGVVEYRGCCICINFAGGKTPLSVCSGYDTKPFDGETPVLELWDIRSTPSLPLPPDQLWTGVGVPVRVPSMGQTEPLNSLLYLKQFNCVKPNDKY